MSKYQIELTMDKLGFKKSSRTTDRVFTLKSLINKYVFDNKRNYTVVSLIIKKPLIQFGIKVFLIN